MKRFVKMLCWFLPLVLLFAGFNLLVDPTNLLRSNNLIADIYDITTSGQNALFYFENYNDRALAQRFALERPGAPNTLVFGSSRGIQISGEMLGVELLNLCVTGAMIDDVAALWEMYLQKGALPERVILSLDLWFFFDLYAYQQRAASAYPEYYNDFVVERLGLDVEPLRKNIFSTPLEMLSPAYFQAGVSLLANGAPDYTVYASAAASDSAATVIRADGSFAYPTSYELAGAETVFERVEKDRPAVLETFAQGSALDLVRVAVFEGIVDSMLERGVEVVLLVSPYYPETTAILEADPAAYPAYGLFDSYLSGFCASRGVTLIGSLRADECGLTAADFMDNLHINSAGVARLVADL